MASLFGFELRDAASIAIIGAADGPTSIFVANMLKSHYMARDYCGGVFLYGAGADCAALLHPR